MRSASRDVLLRAALLATASAFYCSPLSFLSSANASASDAALRVVGIRLWLTLLATVAALVGVISTQLVLGAVPPADLDKGPPMRLRNAHLLTVSIALM
jgi:hypothetical protein